MKKINLLFLLVLFAWSGYAQNLQDTVSAKHKEVIADDPSQYFTRFELFNELQRHKNEDRDFYLNQATFRTVIQIGKRFTTRLDIPYVHNTITTKTELRQSGLGDISFRLLGYRFIQSRNSAVTASIEFSLNTAQSAILGLGKNLIIPMITYTTKLTRQKMLLAVVVQQANSVSGDESRQDINFTKVQGIILKFWSKKFWTVLGPELYFDYINNGVSMTLEARFTYAPSTRINLWAQPGVGLFGDFAARYKWNAELGCRYFPFR